MISKSTLYTAGALLAVPFITSKVVPHVPFLATPMGTLAGFLGAVVGAAKVKSDAGRVMLLGTAAGFAPAAAGQLTNKLKGLSAGAAGQGAKNQIRYGVSAR